MLAVAWYHGHKRLKQISAGELTVVSFLVVIGAALLVVLIRTGHRMIAILRTASSCVVEARSHDKRNA